MNIINLLKNKLDRIITKKEVIVMALIVIPIVILTAVVFSGRINFLTKIAVVSEDGQSINIQSFPKNNKFDIKILDKKPELSSVVLGYYDAIVEKNNGKYKITTVIKSKEDKQIIEDFFNKGLSPDRFESEDRERGMGTKILGFIVMVILMQSVALTILYPEDRSLKIFPRIMTTPVSENQYIFAQSIFTFLCVYIPTYMAVVITKECFGVKMGLSLGMLAILVGILSVIGTAFGLFMSSILKNNITLTASAIAILTSLLSGCLVPFIPKNNVLNAMLNIIPQRPYMAMVEGIEKGKSIFGYKFEFIYLAIFSVLLLSFGTFIIKRKVKQGVY